METLGNAYCSYPSDVPETQFTLRLNLEYDSVQTHEDPVEIISRGKILFFDPSYALRLLGNWVRLIPYPGNRKSCGNDWIRFRYLIQTA